MNIHARRTEKTFLEKFQLTFVYLTLSLFTFTSTVAPVASYANDGPCEGDSFDRPEDGRTTSKAEEHKADSLEAQLQSFDANQRRQDLLRQKYARYELSKIGKLVGNIGFIKPILWDWSSKLILIDGLWEPAKAVSGSIKRMMSKPTWPHYVLKKGLIENGSKALIATWLGLAIGKWMENGMVGGWPNALSGVSFATLGTLAFWHSLMFEALIPLNTDIIPRTEISRFRKPSLWRRATLSVFWPSTIFAALSGGVPLTLGYATANESLMTYGMASIAFAFPAGLAYHAFRKYFKPIFKVDSLKLETMRRLRSPLISRETLIDMELHAMTALLFQVSTPGRNLIYLRDNQEKQAAYNRTIEELEAEIQVELRKPETLRNPGIEKWQQEIATVKKLIGSLKRKVNQKYKKQNERAQHTDTLIRKLSTIYEEIYKQSLAYRNAIQQGNKEEADQIRARVLSLEDQAKKDRSKLIEEKAYPNDPLEIIANSQFRDGLDRRMASRDVENSLASDRVFVEDFKHKISNPTSLDGLFNTLLTTRGELAGLAVRIDHKQDQNLTENRNLNTSEVRDLKTQYDQKVKAAIEILQQVIETADVREKALIEEFKKNFGVHSTAKAVRGFQLRFDDVRDEAKHQRFAIPEMDALLGLKPDGIPVRKRDLAANHIRKYINATILGIVMATAFFGMKQWAVGSIDSDYGDDDERWLRAYAKQIYLSFKQSETETINPINQDVIDAAVAHAKALIDQVMKDIPDQEDDFLLAQLSAKLALHDYTQDDNKTLDRKSKRLSSSVLELSQETIDQNADADLSGFFGAQATKIINGPAEEVVKIFQDRGKINGLEDRIKSFKDVEYMSGQSKNSFLARFHFNTFSENINLWVENKFNIFEHKDDTGKNHQIVFWKQESSSQFKKTPTSMPQLSVFQNAGVVIITPVTESTCRATIYGFQWINSDLIAAIREQMKRSLDPVQSLTQGFIKNNWQNFLQNLTKQNYSGFIRALDREFR